MRAKTIRELLMEKLDILENADNQLVQGIAATLRSIYRALLRFIDRMEIKDGNFVNSDTNNSLLLSLRRTIRRIFEESTYRRKVEQFIEKFDRMEVLNRVLLGRINDIEITGINVNAEKKAIVEGVIDGLLSDDIIKSKFGNPIQSILFTNITNGANVTETKTALRNLVQGTGFEREVSRIATDGMSQFQGTINKAIIDKYELDGFMIVGSLIATSRENCVDMINGSGAFKDLAIRPGVYARADIPAIIEIAKRRGGWNPATTAETYMIYKNGFNERHGFIGIRLNDEENQRRIRRIQESLAA